MTNEPRVAHPVAIEVNGCRVTVVTHFPISTDDAQRIVHLALAQGGLRCTPGAATRVHWAGDQAALGMLRGAGTQRR